jgi:CheY-like chemotaxis protein
VHLSQVITESCSLVRPLAAERHIRLIEDAEPWSGTCVWADQQRLKQVILNLLSNAIKYNRVRGQMSVSCSRQPEQRIRIEVRDTGTGIAAEDLPKLFQPFERLSVDQSKVEGTGLGLALSKRLVEAMRGTLSVESTLGQGSTFTIVLPEAVKAEIDGDVLKESDDTTPVVAAERTYAVLCIEDNLSNLRLIERILSRRPEITLLAAMQGSMGLDLARKHEPDLILLDLNLPDMHGNEVLARLRQEALTKDIPVVVISADATQPQIERLLNAGARAYLTKPLNVKDFLHVIDDVLH